MHNSAFESLLLMRESIFASLTHSLVSRSAYFACNSLFLFSDISLNSTFDVRDSRGVIMNASANFEKVILSLLAFKKLKKSLLVRLSDIVISEFEKMQFSRTILFATSDSFVCIM